MFAVCVMFSALPFAAAADVQNTHVNQNITSNTSVTNTIMDHGLKIGSNGKYVVNLQKWLKNQRYYKGNIDGSFGPCTEKAVKCFQNDSNITVDGWVANQTVCAMKNLTGINIFTGTPESNNSSTDFSNESIIAKNKTAKHTDSSTANSNKTSVNTASAATTAKTVQAASTTTTTKTSTSKKTSTASSSSVSQILASGAKYGYSHSASTAAAMESIGAGDCWAMSDYLYGKLSAAGIHSRIVQYSTAYSSNHRSVQLYENGAWVDVPYSSYGYNMLFHATSSKPGMKIIASS